MNRREFVISTCAGLAGFFEVSGVAGQAKAITPDATEQKDRFSINFKVRGARTVLPPASDRGAP